MAWPVIGTLSGVVVGGGIAWLNEATRWRRQQAVRWDDRKSDLYSQVLGLTNDAVSCAHRVASDPAAPSATISKAWSGRRRR
jgi:hypothetical protein